MKSRILIVDDHDDFRKAVRGHLEKNDYLGLEIYEATTAEMAVAKAACIKPELVLMDISLPSGSGFLALREIKKDHPECDVIILTMFEVESLREMAKEFQATDFVGKSEVYERLIPVINRCLQNRDGKVEKKGGGSHEV